MDGHLLYDTPQMNCFPKTEEYVPNYIGTLPCSNLGDRVYYIYDENNYLYDLKSKEEDELDRYKHDHIHIGRSMDKSTKIMFSKMELIKNIMKASGWFDKSPDRPPDFGNLVHVEPSMQLSSKMENKIYEKRQQIATGVDTGLV